MGVQEDRLFIKAAPDLVWALTTDVMSWPDWNPNVTSVEALDGAALAPGHRYRLTQPAQAPTVWTVTRLEPRRFAWTCETGRLGFEAGHEVVEDGDFCESRLSIALTGRWRVFMEPLMSPILGLAMSRENSGLKAAAEQVR